MKKYLGILILFIIILGIAAVFSLRLVSGEDNWICEKNQWVKHGNPSASMPTSGCGEVKTKPTTVEQPTITPEANIKPTVLDIANALVAKHSDWKVNNLDINISKTEGDYASGGVNFIGEMGGGMWFAAKVNTVWQIVSDGNGVITCDSLKNYPQFPTSIIPECFNETTQEIVKR
jgi:hypothetical protein